MPTNELIDVRDKTAAALRAADADAGASPVLTAVVREFAAKADKAVELDAAGRRWEAVIELEQAGDSAKAAAEADPGAAGPTKESVLAAHLAICMAKANLDERVG
jgi:hypothetical protein